MQRIHWVSNSEQLYWQACFALILTYKYVSETGKKNNYLNSYIFHFLPCDAMHIAAYFNNYKLQDYVIETMLDWEILYKIV